MRRMAVVGVAVAMGLMLSVTQSQADSFRVKASGNESEGWTWQPGTRQVNVGDRVVWTNPTDKTHTVSAYGKRWSKNSPVSPGERTKFTFKKTGRFKYRCMTTGHSAMSDGKCAGMCGKVVVR